MNHMHIGAKNVTASMSFYCDLFGFRKKFDHGDGVFLENDENFLLAIDPVEAVPAWPNWFHLGFCLPSENEVLRMHSKCLEMKVAIARELLREEGGFASFFVFDPDVYKIEISWHNE